MVPTATTIDELEALIRQWGNDRNIINGSTVHAQIAKFCEEFGELVSAILRGDKPKIEDGFGDAIVVLIMMMAQTKCNMKDCMRAAYDEIKNRRGKMVDGVFVKESDL